MFAKTTKSKIWHNSICQVSQLSTEQQLKSKTAVE